MMAWPSYYFWSTDDGYFVDWQEGQIKYDEMDIVTLEDMCNFDGMCKSFLSLCDYLIYGNRSDGPRGSRYSGSCPACLPTGSIPPR